MNGMAGIQVNTHLDRLGEVRDFVEARIGAAGLPAERAGELVLAVDEAVSNIIMHGATSEDGLIEIRVKQDPAAVVVQIRDDGPLFDPTRVEDPHLEISPLVREKGGGFGVYLLNTLVDRVSYRVTEDGWNELLLQKNMA